MNMSINKTKLFTLRGRKPRPRGPCSRPLHERGSPPEEAQQWLKSVPGDRLLGLDTSSATLGKFS